MNRTKTPFTLPLLPVLPALLLVLLCVFTGFDRTWSSQIGAWAAGAFPGVRSGMVLLVGGLALGVVFWLAGRPRLRRALPRRLPEALLALALLAGQAACLLAALPAIREMPQGIDHPCFLFRIREFYKAFPALGAFNPWWNGGTEHFIGVTSGAHAFAFLLFPFLAFGSLEAVYAPALFAWIYVLGPWLAVLSARALGVRWRGALAAGLLMLPFTRAEFLFFWQSGNVGGLATCVMSPPAVALGYRLAVLRRGGWRAVLVLALAAWLLCIWPAGLITAAGLALGALANAPRIFRKPPNVRILVAAALALALLAPWLWVLAFPSRGIVDYAAGGSGRSAVWMVCDGLRMLGRRLLEWHPLLLCFGLLGTIAVAPRRARRFLLPLFALLAAATVSVGWKRQSQIDRAALQMATAAVVPAAVLLGRLFAPRTVPGAISGAALAFARGLAAAALLAGPCLAARHAAGRAGFKLWPAEPVVYEFAEWVRANVPEGGRLAFADETDCKYDWGKPAYFPILAGREMMADDYYGFPKGLTSRRFPPKAYRGSVEDYLRFTRLWGITHWAVTDDRNRALFEAETTHFRHAAHFRMQSAEIDVYAFLDQPDPTPFLSGTGRLAASERGLNLSLDDPAQETVVLRYNWRPGLHCDPPARIAPYEADENLRFIAVQPNGARTVRIRYRPGWRRLEPNFDGTFHH